MADIPWMQGFLQDRVSAKYSMLSYVLWYMRNVVVVLSQSFEGIMDREKDQRLALSQDLKQANLAHGNSKGEILVSLSTVVATLVWISYSFNFNLW